MVDNISIVADASIPNTIERGLNNTFRWMGILFKPVFAKGDDVYVAKYEGDYKGFRFTYQNDKLTISNSLHKFYKGNNYSDFTYSDLVQSISEIEVLTGIKAEKFQVNKMEFGLNIILNTSAMEVIKSLMSFKMKTFELMKAGILAYGKRFRLTDYDLKLYDKVTQVKIKDRKKLVENILRFEIVYKRNRAIPEIDTLSDLRDFKKLEVLIAQLKSHLNKIVIDGTNDFKKISPREIELFYAGQNSDFWTTVGKINKDKGKEKKEHYRKIIAAVLVKNCKPEIVVAMEQKFIELLGS